MMLKAINSIKNMKEITIVYSFAQMAARLLFKKSVQLSYIKKVYFTIFQNNIM